jgi:exodeoxyribonuclease-5
LIQLTPEQVAAVDAFGMLYAGRRRRLTIGGLAGTGKSTIIRAIVDQYRSSDIAVCAPTGKAAHVLRTKGVEGARTLHSLIYTPRGEDADGKPIFSRTGEPVPRVVIVDEASMLSADVVRDLEKVARHVLYVGDHGQLEPIGDDPGLMSAPDIRLEQIHRQVEGSAIIRFAHHVRRGYAPKSFGLDARVQQGWSDDLIDFDVLIVGYNATRQKINNWMRRRLSFTTQHPQVGEKVICLRNNAEREVWNGMTGTVLSCSPHQRRMDVMTDDGPRHSLRYNPDQFGAERTLPFKRTRSKSRTLWDFAYAVTCHKYQGSEAERVAVVDEVSSAWSGERWRYTAATRASKELRWVLK